MNSLPPRYKQKARGSVTPGYWLGSRFQCQSAVVVFLSVMEQDAWFSTMCQYLQWSRVSDINTFLNISGLLSFQG